VVKVLERGDEVGFIEIVSDGAPDLVRHTNSAYEDSLWGEGRRNHSYKTKLEVTKSTLRELGEDPRAVCN